MPADRPAGVDTPKPLKSFEQFRKIKGKQWKTKCTKKKEKDEEEVTIAVGLLEWKETEMKLKPVRGKRIALRVSNKAPYQAIRSKAIEKWKAYQSHLYIEDEEYALVYEDGKEAQFLPGTVEFFNLLRYHEEIGKDYKRIVLYLCSSTDIRSAEKSKQECDSADSDISGDEFQLRPGKKMKSQIEGDEELAKILQSQLDSEAGQFDVTEDNISLLNPIISDCASIQEDSPVASMNTSYKTAAELKCAEEKPTQFTSCEDLLRSLSSTVDESDQFFLVVRRGSSFQRQLKIWQRESRKSSPEKILRVHFAGEDGIDTGAMAQEFLATAVHEIGKEFFPNGAPIDSMLHVHNGFFLTCGQIVAVSLVQGGPPPRFLNDNAFQMLVNPEVNVNELKEDVLTPSEKLLLQTIKEDPAGHQDTILEHGYTGVVDLEHIHDITGTVMVSLLSRRSLYLKEFGKGLELFGLASTMRGNVDLCKKLFVNDTNVNIVDANYLVTMLKPLYSQEGTSKRIIEEGVMDNFQDLLMKMEDENMIGHSEMMAWNYQDKLQDEELHVTNQSEAEDSPAEESPGHFHSAVLTPSGVLGWFTGQKHRPVNGDDLAITVVFDHDCLQRNPKHSVCFPVVSACSRVVTLPVDHMKDPEDFTRIFLLAYCKGQAFARP